MKCGHNAQTIILTKFKYDHSNLRICYHAGHVPGRTRTVDGTGSGLLRTSAYLLWLFSPLSPFCSAIIPTLNFSLSSCGKISDISPCTPVFRAPDKLLFRYCYHTHKSHPVVPRRTYPTLASSVSDFKRSGEIRAWFSSSGTVSFGFGTFCSQLHLLLPSSYRTNTCLHLWLYSLIDPHSAPDLVALFLC